MYRTIEESELKVQKSNGYVYFIDAEHPLKCGNSHKVYYHRHVGSLIIGRWVTPNEHVHHIDEIKDNNSEDNLLVLTDSEHTQLHHILQGHSDRCNYICKTCGTTFKAESSKHQAYCSHTCHDKDKIKDSTITKELLDSLIPTMSWVALGRLFNYSDNGIKKRAKALGCVVPKRK